MQVDTLPIMQVETSVTEAINKGDENSIVKNDLTGMSGNLDIFDTIIPNSERFKYKDKNFF